MVSTIYDQCFTLRAKNRAEPSEFKAVVDFCPPVFLFLLRRQYYMMMMWSSYRRVFDYHTRHVDFDAPAPPLPECLSAVMREMEKLGLKPSSPDQLTLNEYNP